MPGGTCRRPIGGRRGGGKPPGGIARARHLITRHANQADVLRSREVCADLDAVAQGAGPAYWTRHRLRAGSGRCPVKTVGRAALSLLRTHPDRERRVAALADCAALHHLVKLTKPSGQRLGTG